MDKIVLKALWAGMFILCAVLGFIPEPTGGNKVLMIVFAALFFLPPAVLVWQSFKLGDCKELRLVRNLALISLGGTLVLLIFNILSPALILLMSEKAAIVFGDILYGLLVVISTPMICGQYWAYSLLLWAGLLWCSIGALKKWKK